jgi:hypothetical protein
MPAPPSIPRRCLQGLLIALFGALLLLPHVQRHAKIPADRKLSGIRVRVRDFPALRPGSWLRGEFAEAADAWIRDNLGLRGYLICLNRQIRYSCFGQVEAAPLRKRALVIGREPVLFENILLVDALRPPQITREQMDDFVARLARMQEQLRAQGMAFLVILAPNKAFLTPDSLPVWARDRITGDTADHVTFIDSLRRHQVPHLDSMALFRELGPDHDDMVPPHGIHWSHRGAWIAWQHAIPVINEQGLLPPLPVPETEDIIFDKPSAMNDELRAQLNLFTAAHAQAVPSAYPVAAPLPPGTQPRLKALVVGDSFGFTLVDAMARSQLCRTIHYWFYLKSAKEARPAAYDSRRFRGIPNITGIGNFIGTTENARRILEDKNLVILAITTFNIDKSAWRFDRLVNQLYGEPGEDTEPFEPIEVNLED